MKAWCAETAIFYLESVAVMGYVEAYFELYKAHAMLARELRNMSVAAIERVLRDHSLASNK